MFSLLNRLLTETSVTSMMHVVEPVEQTVNWLVETIKQRPIIESQNPDDEDFVLQGLFLTLKNILASRRKTNF
jgi:hypothetical protein